MPLLKTTAFICGEWVTEGDVLVTATGERFHFDYERKGQVYVKERAQAFYRSYFIRVEKKKEA